MGIKKSLKKGAMKYKSYANKELARRKAISSKKRNFRKETKSQVLDAKLKTERAQAIKRATFTKSQKTLSTGLQNFARNTGYNLPKPSQPVRRKIRVIKKRRRRSRRR